MVRTRGLSLVGVGVEGTVVENLLDNELEVENDDNLGLDEDGDDEPNAAGIDSMTPDGIMLRVCS